MINGKELSNEEKKQLMNRLKELYRDRPLIYLKFTKCEEYAENIKDGLLYANTVQWFREQEKKTGERGQGDQYEMINNFDIEEAWIIDSETDIVLKKFTSGNCTIRNKSDDDLPMVCFVGVSVDEVKLECVDNQRAKFSILFEDIEKQCMREKFGDYCVLLDVNELEERIVKYAKENDCNYYFEKVQYCPQNQLDRIESFTKSISNRFFYKNPDLSYQREYRLILECTIPTNHFFNIGKLEKARVLKCEELADLIFYYDLDKNQ